MIDPNLMFLGIIISIMFISFVILIIIDKYINYQKELNDNIRNVEFSKDDKLLVRTSFQYIDQDGLIKMKQRIVNWLGVKSENVLLLNDSKYKNTLLITVFNDKEEDKNIEQ